MTVTELFDNRRRSDVTILAAGGQRIRVSVRRGTGVPLVLCNGIGAGLEVLDPLVAELDPNTTIIRFDVPGAGGSPASLVPYGFPYLAWVLGRLIDPHTRLRRRRRARVVVGRRPGTAIRTAEPRRCRRLVLVATATGALMVPGRPRGLAKMLTPHRFTDADYAASIAGEVWTSLPVLPLIRQRTLIVAGTDDPIIPVTNAHIMKTLLPHAILHTHAGGHIDLLTNATELAPVIETFRHT